MKKMTLVLTLVTLFSLELCAQKQVSVKLSEEQIRNLKTRRIGNIVDVSLGGNIDKVLQKYKFKNFFQTYPLALYFDHDARERVLQYYTFVIDSTDATHELFVPEILGMGVFEAVDPVTVPIPTYSPNDFAMQDPPAFTPDQGSQWYLTLIKAKQAWDITHGNSTVKIGVIDQGFRTSHEDLVDQIVYTDGTVTAVPTHGTMVAGAAAGETDNGAGLSSIGFNSKLMLYVFDFPYNDMMHASLNGAKVLNNSYYETGCNYNQAHQDIINMVVANGTTIVAAAGNGTISGNCGVTDGYSYPACYDNVISVGGTWYDSFLNIFDERLTFNNKVDIVAPGFELTVPGGSNDTWYTNQSGTSLATPLVTGTVALMYAVKSCLKPGEVEYILKKSADQGVFNTTLHPENAPYINNAGAGRLDAYAALQLTQNWPQNLVNYASVGGPSLVCTSETFTINNIPTGSTVSWSTNYPAGLSINSGSGVATRQSAFNGQITVKATVTTGCGSVEITKIVQVGATTANFSILPYPDYCGSAGYVMDFVAQINNVNYSWTVNGGTLMGGQGTQAIWALKNGPTMAVHCYVTGTSASNCYSPAGISSLYVYDCFGFSSISTSPNPASNSLSVELSDNITESDEVRVEIRNDFGNLVISKTAVSNKFDINTTQLPDGLYILKVGYKDRVSTQRIVIKK